MSTPTTLDIPAPSASTGAPGQVDDDRLPFRRLLRTELRKTVDTRSGRWLLVVMTVAVVATIALTYAFAEASNQTYRTFLLATVTPISVFVPLLGILSVTSEWSQRTGLVTFTLEPRRLRVIAAKTLAVVVLGMALLAVAATVAAGANLAAGSLRDASGAWDLSLAQAGGVLLIGVIFLVQGVAFGVGFLNSAVAIVTYLVVPTVWSILGSLVPAMRTAASWLDLNQTSGPLIDGTMTGTAWAQLVASVALWVVLPFLVGGVRVQRYEFR